MNITIREARPEDAQAIAKVNIASWRSTYRGLIADSALDGMRTEEYVKKWDNSLAHIDDKYNFCFVAVAHEEEIIGYVRCGKNRHEQFDFEAELYAVYLLKEFQGHGIGKQLFTQAIDEFRRRGILSMLLFVLAANTGSRKFYESFSPDFTADEIITIDNGQYCDFCYGWSDIGKISQ